MSNDRTLLKRLAESLLWLDHPGELLQAAQDLHALGLRVTGLSDDPTGPATEAIPLGSGLALDPVSAARCTVSYARTAKFLRGVHRAIRLARERFHDGPIEVLYAGCGPLAPLAVPLMTRFSPAEVRFTLLDIHPVSLGSAKELVERLGLSDHVRDYVLADAATYVHPAETPIHILVTEAMQRALTKEPQVSITGNLGPQLCEGGILVPETITVDACLCDPAAEFTLVTDPDPSSPPVSRRLRIPLGTLMELDLAHLSNLTDDTAFPAIPIRIPPASIPPLRLMLRTRVTVFEDIVLEEHEDGITSPHLVNEAGGLPSGGTIVFQYGLGPSPGFRVLRVSSPAS